MGGDMFRVKVFSSGVRGDDAQMLESAINKWLESAHPSIRQMTQSSSTEHVIVTFLYDDGQRDAQTRVASAVVPKAFEHSLSDAELDPADDQPGILPEAELPY